MISIHPLPRRNRQNLFAVALACLGILVSAPIYAQDNPTGTTHAPADAASSPGEQEGGTKGGLSAEDLAKIAQNPVANMISVPFQNNFNFNVGPNNVCQYVLNVQPVIPISLNQNWNLITRWITPIINQPSPAPGVSSAFGLGDINPTFFLSPANSSPVIWGVGPTTTLPTATAGILGTGKWQVGPSAVALTIQGHWVMGALVNNQWSVGGWGPKNQNNFLVQPFINYNLPHGWYLSTSPVITANWNANHRNMWTVPVGGGFGKIIKLGGKLPVNLRLAAFYNACTPQYGSDWQLQFQIQFLLPKALFTRN